MMILRFGKSAASWSIADGCAWRISAPMAAGHAGAHAGGADVDHHRGAQLVDHLEQRVVAPIVHREVLHDRMEVEADQAELASMAFFGLRGSPLALRRLDRAPAWMMRSGWRFHMACT